VTSDVSKLICSNLEIENNSSSVRNIRRDFGDFGVSVLVHALCICEVCADWLRCHDNGSCKNCATTLSRMSFSGYIGHVTIFS